MKDVILKFIKNEMVLVISALLAAVSAFIVVPDSRYISYIDFRTLSILLSLMMVMSVFKRLGVFSSIGEALALRTDSLRMLAIVLVMLNFIFSMFITNDVALLTFVPFTVIVLNMVESSGSLIAVIVLETIAANLGSMMLPMGNPQNIYLYSLSGMSLAEFVLLMLPYGVISLAAIVLLCFVMVPDRRISLRLNVEEGGRKAGDGKTGDGCIRLAANTVLFAVSLLVVVRVMDYRIGLIITVIGIFITDRRAILKADYSLILTFVFLFIFIGNMKRIDSVNELLSGVVRGHEIAASVISSQIISNVPAAVLLSGFTDNVRGLIVGTDIGGLGTLIASMASLISFKQYCHTAEASAKKYIAVFSAVNFGMLALLLAVAAVVG